MADDINVQFVNDGDINVQLVNDGDINITLSSFGKEVWKNDSFTATSGQTVFTLNNTPRLNSQIVFKGGVFQAKTTDYTISGAIITFTSGLYEGEFVDVSYVQN